MSTQTEAPTKASSSALPLWGNVGHCISLTSTLLFAACVCFFLNKDDASDPLFDDTWRQEGFCVTNPETPAKNSHAACFYVDAVMAIVLGALYLKNRHNPELKHEHFIMGPGILGILGHGIAHGGIARSMQKIMEAVTEEEAAVVKEEEHTTFFRFIGPLLFWLPLLKASMPNAKLRFVLLGALISNHMTSIIPDNFQFTIVQTILMVAFSANQLMRSSEEKKDIHYSLYAWIVSIPITLVGWMESTMCSSFVKDILYGHLVYDAYIPVGMLIWYFLCMNSKKDVKVKTH